MNDDRKSSISSKITHIIDETRIVLPGTQTLLGFQLAAVFNNGFESLPSFLKWIHLLSLLVIALSIMVLLIFVAHHRIVHRGEDTESLHRFASKTLTAGMALLAIGMILDIYVVIVVVTGSNNFSLIVSILLAFLFYLAWFGYTFHKRKQMKEQNITEK